MALTARLFCSPQPSAFLTPPTPLPLPCLFTVYDLTQKYKQSTGEDNNSAIYNLERDHICDSSSGNFKPMQVPKISHRAAKFTM